MKIKDPKKLTGEALTKAHSEGCSDTKKVLENLYPDFFEKKETYKRGEMIRVDGSAAIIASIGSPLMHLIISLSDGGHWGEPFTVKNSSKITHKELTSELIDEYKIEKL